MRDKESTLPCASIYGGRNRLDELFAAQNLRPAAMAPVRLEDLSPFQRVLLLTDGTVTQLLEAHSGEAVVVIPTNQQKKNLLQADPWLEVDADTTVLWRRALLRGADSARPFCYALALIALERLPTAVAVGLEKGEGGLGDLLRRCRVETFREHLWCGMEPLDPLFEFPGSYKGLLVLSRTYRIISGGQPLALISESFPWMDDTD